MLVVVVPLPLCAPSLEFEPENEFMAGGGLFFTIQLCKRRAMLSALEAYDEGDDRVDCDVASNFVSSRVVSMGN